jgi:hypothetical protein
MLFNLFGKKEDAQQPGLFSDHVYIHSGAKQDAILQLAQIPIKFDFYCLVWQFP